MTPSSKEPLFILRSILLLPFIFISLCMSVTSYAVTTDEDSGLEDNLTYHVYDDVDLVSTLRFEYGKPRIVVKLVYPQLASETEREGVDQFNELAWQTVQEEIAAFRNKVKTEVSSQRNAPKTKATNNLYVDYNTSYLKTKREHIISIRFNTQGLIAGSRPYQSYRALNYNLDKNQLIALHNLFLPNADYLSVLSRYTHSVLARQLRDKSRLASGTAPQPENFAVWNIKPNGLLISFSTSQVAPSIDGAQTVLVPYSALIELISPKSPIAYCVLHRAKCFNSNLVTGGFIDEAALNKGISVKVCQTASRSLTHFH